MIAQVFQIVQAICIAGLIWWTEISREKSKNVRQSDLVLDHLIVPLLVSQGRHVLMTPGVTPDLMALIVHALDEGRISSLRVVDLAFAAIVTDEEERSFDPFLFQDIEQSRRVDIRAIVECEGNLSRDTAVLDTDSVFSAAYFWSRHRGSIDTGRGLIGIAGRAIHEKTGRGIAIIGSRSARPL